MFYSNGNYMQDFNYYNQNPNVNCYNPYLQNGFQNSNMAQGLSVNAMYPAIYRIISPVVNQVLKNTNTAYLTDDALNNLVDTVYSIVEGDINLAEEQNNKNSQNMQENNGRNSSNNSNNSNANLSNKHNNLLKDLIKIIILNEISCRRQNLNSNMMPNNNFNQPMYM